MPLPSGTVVGEDAARTMTVEITEMEFAVFEEYYRRILKDEGNLKVIANSIRMQAYFHALCVKYNQDPIKVCINAKNKCFEPKLEEKDNEKRL